MRNIYHLILTVVLGGLFFLPPAIGGEELTHSQKLWAESVQGRPYPRLLNRYEYLDMVLFSAQKGVKIPPRDVTIASILYRNNPKALQSEIHSRDVQAFARECLGRCLKEAEEKSLNAVYKKIEADFNAVHPGGIDFQMDITVGLGFVRQFQRSLAHASYVEAALHAIERYHGYTCDLRKDLEPDFAVIKEAIDRNLPVLLETPEGEYRLCFGYLYQGEHPSLIVSDASKTTILYDVWAGTQRDQESLKPFIIRRRKNNTFKTKSDYRVNGRYPLQGRSCTIEPVARWAGCKSYIFMNWRKSAVAYKEEICAALKIDPRTALVAPKRPAAPPASPDARTLWEYFVKGQREAIGGAASLVECVALPAEERISPTLAVIASNALADSNTTLSEFSLTANKLYKTACRLANDDFLLPDEDKVQEKALHSLIEAAKQGYGERKAAAEEERRESDEATLELVLTLRPKAPEAGMEEILQEIARWHGWTCVVETEPDLPFDLYAEAFHKEIPVILKDRAKGEYLLGVGYIKDGTRTWLIVADPKSLPSGRPLAINRSTPWPESGLSLVEFKPESYTPYFLHTWTLSGDGWEKEVAKIFNLPDPAEAPGTN